MRGVIRCQTTIKLVCLLYLVMKMQRNIKNKIYTSEQAPSKVPIFLLDVKMLRERFDRRQNANK